jgi:hypothetical protein
MVFFHAHFPFPKVAVFLKVPLFFLLAILSYPQSAGFTTIRNTMMTTMTPVTIPSILL